MFKVICALFLLCSGHIFGADAGKTNSLSPNSCPSYSSGLQYVRTDEPDYKKAKDTFASCETKCPKCEFQLGIVLLESDVKAEQIEGLHLIIKAAEDGYGPAQEVVKKNKIRETLETLTSARSKAKVPVVHVPDLKLAPMAKLEFDENLDIFKLGLTHLREGINQYGINQAEASQHFKKSAKNGIIEAKYFLGAMAMLDKKMIEAESLLSQAMKSGSALAAYELGTMYMHRSDFEQARSCFKRYPHNPKMRHQLENIKRKQLAGRLVTINKKTPINRTAVKLYVAKANLDRIDGFINGLEAYSHKDYSKALRYIDAVSEKSMHSAEFVHMLGHVSLANGYLEEGIESLWNAALRGYQPAAFDLGLRYLCGLGVVKDLLMAAQCFAPYQDDSKFRYHLGLALAQSIFPEDQEIGFSLIEEAATDGYVLAQTAMDKMVPMFHDEWGYYPAEPQKALGAKE